MAWTSEMAEEREKCRKAAKNKEIYVRGTERGEGQDKGEHAKVNKERHRAKAGEDFEDPLSLTLSHTLSPGKASQSSQSHRNHLRPATASCCRRCRSFEQPPLRICSLSLHRAAAIATFEASIAQPSKPPSVKSLTIAQVPGASLEIRTALSIAKSAVEIATTATTPCRRAVSSRRRQPCSTLPPQPLSLSPLALHSSLSSTNPSMNPSTGCDSCR
ncbi:uncharacterized protein DS421_11g347940 [Arachis hypogaea]|nr:uncharacterized protein DS421_11g347940 [Arachis hypogaea]